MKGRNFHRQGTKQPPRKTGGVSDYDLRFAVVVKADGRAEVMYFASPQDAGTTIKLTALEREKLTHALAGTGFQAIPRDEGSGR